MNENHNQIANNFEVNVHNVCSLGAWETFSLFDRWGLRIGYCENLLMVVVRRSAVFHEQLIATSEHSANLTEYRL